MSSPARIRGHPLAGPIALRFALPRLGAHFVEQGGVDESDHVVVCPLISGLVPQDDSIDDLLFVTEIDL